MEFNRKNVSVPCRGTAFLNKKFLNMVKHDLVSVPCRGTAFLNKSRELRGKEETMFPSPVGELHFSIEIISMMDDNSCFRPLSGNCISQSESIIAYILDYFSFRPLSGNCISQYTRQAEKAMNEVFPSPVGELHFSIVLRAMATDRKRLVSVPCRGTAFLNKPEAFDKITGFGFRPLSGNCISQYQVQCRSSKVQCFRPLSGNCISQ